jgi:phosphoglycolate phosphatase-like HAD superfamily hydrolase
VIHDTFELAYKISLETLEGEMTRDEYRDLFNGNIYESSKIMKKGAGDFFEKQNKAFEHLRIEKNIKQFLKELYDKYSLFIISSNQEKALNTYFQNNNFINIFKEVLGMETDRSKIEKFKTVLEKQKLKPDECIFVTDTLGDILEANKVGIKTIAVDFGFHCRERLEKGKPFKIISDFNEVEEILKDL